MKWPDLILGFSLVFMILLTIRYFFFSDAFAAELTGRDYPYWIYRDNGVIRYCEQPELGDTHQICWSNGVDTICKILPIDEGYIDC